MSYRVDIEKLARAFWVLALGVGLLAAPAAAAPLRVRGGAVIQARATPVEGALEIRGQLEDESNRPFGNAPIQLFLPRGPGGAPRDVPVPTACGPTSPHNVHRGANAKYFVVRTNDAGNFCVALHGTAISGNVRLHFAGNDYFAPAGLELAVDSTRQSLALRFSPEPRILSLERPRHLIGVETHVESSSGGLEEGAPSIQLALKLKPDRGHARELATTTLRAGDRALFSVNASALGGVGPARLLVVFAGSPRFSPARVETVVERTSMVTLSLAHPVARSDPHSGAAIDVRVRSRLGAVPGGTVEARLGDESVGSAPVVEGAARVVAVFDAPRARETVLALRYLPDSPWWLPGAPIDVAVPLSPPSPWRRVPWLLAAAAVALWVMRGWRRPARHETAGRTDPTEPPGRPALDLVERGPARSGWRGYVRDAHEGTPIEGATVLLRVPSFGTDGIAASTVTDADGRFSLDHLEYAPAEGTTLEASARWHSTLVEPLVAPGHLAIALVSRRRALLDRLVSWARRRGKPWSGRGEPTPGHVAEVATKRAADDIASWADDVQQAAFGPAPPDENVERELQKREPHGGGEAP